MPDAAPLSPPPRAGPPRLPTQSGNSAGPWAPGRGLALLVAALAAGCGWLPGGPEALPGQTSIRFTFWGEVSDVRVWQALQRAFHARQDRIRVRLEHISGVAYHQKLLAMKVGRTSPDVMACDDEPFPELADRGVFEDLGPYLEREPALRPEVYYREFIESWRWNDRIYALPYLGHCLLVYFNRDMLRAVGLPDPPDDWTWDDFLHYGRALTRDLDGDGRIDQYGAPRLTWAHCLPFVWGAGGDMLNPERTRCLLDSAASIRGYGFMYDQIHRYRITPLMSDLPGMNTDAMFLSGRVAMVVHLSHWLSHCRHIDSLDWDVAHMPRGPLGRSTRTTGEGIAISADSRRKAAAWEWVSFVMGDEGQPYFAREGRGIPGVRRIAEATFADPRTPQREERFLEAMNYARRQIISAKFMEYLRLFDREWDRMLMGQLTAEQLCRRVTAGINRILASNEP